MPGTATAFAASLGGLVAVTVTPVDISELAIDPAPACS
jgi:hypothetical protein